MKIFNRKNRAYTEVILVVSILMLFLTAHFLANFYYNNNKSCIWMGIAIDGFIADFVLYTAIFFTFILLVFIIHRNFNVKKKQKRYRR